jgi:hypothetical protein
LASLFGENGLLVRLRVTYGGQLSLSVSCSVRHQINLSETFSIAVALPMKFHISHFHLNCFVNINLHRNACRVWLETPPGRGESLIQKISIQAEFGSSTEQQQEESVGSGIRANGAGGGDATRHEQQGHSASAARRPQAAAAAAAAASAFSSSSSAPSSTLPCEESAAAAAGALPLGSSSGGGGGGGGPCVDAQAVTQLVLVELRSVLSRKLVSPHFVEFPFKLAL